MPTAKKTEQSVSKKTSGLAVLVYDIKGKEKGELEMPSQAFGVKVNKPLLAQALRVYQFNQRQGTASTKTRGQVIGSTRKIYRQKGTGKARHGSIKAPIFVGGGVVGGPQPRDYSLKINKKQKRQAFFSALTLKLKEKNIFGIEDNVLKIEAKTKLIAGFLENMKLTGKKIMFVLPKMEKNNFVLASRNINGVDFVDLQSLNIFQILNCSKLVFFESAVEVLKSYFLKNEH